MNKDDKSFNHILRFAGIVLIIMGVLAVYRGFTQLIPTLGVDYGFPFVVMGFVFALLGVVFLVLTILRDIRWKKMREQEEAREKTEETP